MTKNHLLKFKQGEFSRLRERLLEDLSNEHFAILFGKMEIVNGIHIINVIETRFLKNTDYNAQNKAHLNIKKELIYYILIDINNRYDVDTIIDVHTHPFSISSVAFSAVDDKDEKTFFLFLKDKFDDINYASVVSRK
jgi:hypothetical protein